MEHFDPKAASPEQAERFLAEVVGIRSAKPGAKPETSSTLNETVGIDLPGVGVVLPLASAEFSPVCARRETAVDEAPEDRAPLGGAVSRATLHLNSRFQASIARCDEAMEARRERLFAQLVFAARDLAQAQLEPATESEPAFCVECVKDAYGDGRAIAHEDTCRTGRVLRLVAELVGTVEPGEGGAA